MNIGRFLEVSLQTADIGTSVLFYEALGFRQLDVGETWHHPYAVLSDGRVHIGLHAYEFESPALTFVHPDLAGSVPDFLARGITFEFSKLGDDEFNEVGFFAPFRQMVTLLEARTFSPPAFDDRDFSLCGKFQALAVPVDDLEWASAFWERLGFNDRYEQTDDRISLRGRDFAVACCHNINLRQPALQFRVANIDKAAAALADQGIRIEEPGPLPGGKGATLLTPEGLTLHLLAQP